MELPPIYRHTLTGSCRPRRGWFGRIVMQIEVKVEALDPWPKAGPMPPIAGERPGAFEERKAEYARTRNVREVLGTSFEWRDARASDFVLSCPGAPSLQLAQTPS